MIQHHELSALVGNDLTNEYHNWLVATMRRYGIQPGAESDMFLAQVMHESGGLRHTLELASGEAYEGRADLGNTQPGDGKRYKGRGLIQLTGRHNYGRYQAATGHPVIDAPQLLERPRLAADVAGWYWQSRGIGTLFDGSLNGEALLEAVTRRINGGLNGLADRRAWLQRVRSVRRDTTNPPAPPVVPGRATALVLNQGFTLAHAEALARSTVTGAPVIIEGDIHYRASPRTGGAGDKLDVRVGDAITTPPTNPNPQVGKAAVQSSGMIGSILSTGGAFALALLPAFGVEVTPELEQAAMQFIAAFGLLAINGRAKAEKPITGVWRAK